MLNRIITILGIAIGAFAIFIVIGILVVQDKAKPLSNNPRTQEPQTLLKADRKAPLGWVYLTIYHDSTFQFTTTGLRPNLETNYFGKADIKGDSIFFHYIDSIPRAGKIATFNDNAVTYISREDPERLQIKHSILTHDIHKK